ncbi:MAG: M15 family metallopeptidase [Mogibacterium sp.]|nr:M15 family metallopeptidase [Mogibacterium sp.]
MNKANKAARRKKKNKRLRGLIILDIVLALLVLLGFLAGSYIKGGYADSESAATEAADEIIRGIEPAVKTASAIEATIEEEERRMQKDAWSLLLVNPWNKIPESFEVETAATEKGYEVDERVREPLEAMLADCREAGYSPVIISAFRTRETQQYLYDRTANKNDTAYPGTSEHECGLAIDIIDASSSGWADPLIKEQEDLPAQKWLMENCHEYGFILRYPHDKEDITGIIYEPWHYRYVGKEHAAKIMESGKCLEEYLGRIDKDKERIGSN